MAGIHLLDNYIRLFLDDILYSKEHPGVRSGNRPASYLLSLFFAWFINELRPKIRALVTLMFYAPPFREAYTLSGRCSSPATAYGLPTHG